METAKQTSAPELLNERALGLSVLGVVLAACSTLPELPTDPEDRCSALGGVPMHSPPMNAQDGTVAPPEYVSCWRDPHQSEADVRRARRAWHEKNGA